MLVTHFCSGCAADREFTTFDCAEHPDECVELVCVACGLGLEVAPPRRLRRAAPSVELRRAS